MKKFLIMFATALVLVSCSSKKSLTNNRNFDDYGVKVQTSAISQNAYKIKPSSERVSYTIPDPRKPKDKKRLKGLTLDEAKEKVLSEAIIAHGCALIVQPNYSYDLKGKKVVRITVYGYPANYEFPEEGGNK